MKSLEPTVLVVDDSAEDRTSYRYWLRREGNDVYHFVEFDCGEEALVWCRTHAPTIILLDYMLPDLDGLTFLQRLRQQREDDCVLPAVMLTGQGDEQVAVQAMKAGAQDYLVKDRLTDDLLCRTVRSVIERVNLAEQVRQQQEQLRLLNAELEMKVEKRTIELQATNQQLQRELQKRRQTQHTLEEQAELLDLAHDAITARTPEGVITFWNRGAERMYGWTREKALGQVIHLLLKTQFPQPLTEIETTIQATGYWEGEIVHTRADGSYVNVASRWVLRRDASDRPIGILEINNDITQRKQAEAWLRESEERWQYALEGNGDGLWDWNIQTRKVFHSKRWKEILGYGEEEIRDDVDEWDKRLHPDDKARIYEALNQCLRGETTQYISEYRILCKDNTYRWILDRGRVFAFTEAGSPLRMIGTHTDITDRRASEAALRRYERIVAATTDAICLLDRHYTHQLVNQSYLNWHRLPADRLIGRSIRELMGSEYFETAIKPKLDQCLAGEIVQDQLWFEYLAAGRQFVSVTYSPYYETEQIISGVVVSLRNLTELKQAETALQESQARFAGILENASDAIISIDINQRITLFNQGAEKIFGYTADEVLGKPIDLLLPSRFMTCHQQHIEQFGKSLGKARRMGERSEIFGRSKDGTEFPAEASISKLVIGDEVVFTAFLQNIAQRKQAEDALRKSEERWQLVIRGNNDAIWDWDILMDQMLCSPRWYEILGYGENEISVSYEEWKKRIHPEDVERVMSINRDYLARKLPTYAIEYRLRCKNGSYTWVMARAQAEWDEQGNPVRIVGSLADIRDRKQSELELQQAKEAAEVANQSKSIFLANMSHELRTPLNVILGFTQVLRRDTALSSAHQETVQIIHRSGEHLLHLINDILDFSKIEAGRTLLDERSFDLYTLLQSLQVMMSQRATAKGLLLHLEISPQTPQYITADADKLRQVLLNLLSNAIKFTERGEVTLRVKPVTNLKTATNRQIACSDPVATFPLLFEVEDTGVGIASHEIEIIFDAFAQSRIGKSTPGGTGLGLTISRHFVQLMGGTISVDSVVGRGSLFQIRLPVQLAQVKDVPTFTAHRQLIGLAPDQPSYRILVVDDQPENRLLLVRLMLQLQMEVKEAANGVEALALWREWHPHLIWMDIRMPLLDGYEVTRQIRAEQAQLKVFQNTIVIALTAHASMSDRNQAIASGCNDFVTKPFREDLLYDKMAEHLGLRFVYGEGPPLDSRTLNSTPSGSFPVESLSVMSVDWVNALYREAKLGDEDEIQRLLQQIPATHRPLADWLNHLAHNYQFEPIKRLAQENLNLRGP